MLIELPRDIVFGFDNGTRAVDVDADVPTVVVPVVDVVAVYDKVFVACSAFVNAV